MLICDLYFRNAEPKCDIVLVGWHGNKAVKSSTDQSVDIVHYLRLCGIDNPNKREYILIKWRAIQNQDLIIPLQQAGFRKKYSTIDNAFTLMSLGQKYISKKKGHFYCIFIDFAKAFDSIDHEKLWKAFAWKNIDGKFFNMFQSVYSS